MRLFYGAATAIDVGNIRINNDIVNLFFDNLTTDNVFQNDNIRIFRADGAYPVKNPTT
jgi:3D (Asp-Asp-Asp) domain-containing protein